MTQIHWLLFFHILGAFLICGGAGVGMSSGIALGRLQSVSAIKFVSIMGHRSSQFVTLPGSILTLATGIWFVADYELWALSDLWLAASFVLWIVAAVLDLAILGPHATRIHALASKLEADGIESSAELTALTNAKRGPLTGNVLLIITITFLVLMVFQPGS